MSSQHHPQRHAFVPLERDLIEPLLDGGQQHFCQIALQAHEDGLGFRVAHAAVELQRLHGAAGFDHQPGVEEAGVRDAVGRHATHRGQDDLFHGAAVHLGCDHRRWGISAHAARVGTLVSVQQAFVVLAGGQCRHLLAITQHDEAGFLTLKKGLDHHARAAFVVGHAQGVVDQHEVDGLVRFSQRHGHDHTLASRQAIGLHDNRRTHPIHIGMRLGGVGEGFVRRRGNAMALHEGLGKRLGAF